MRDKVARFLLTYFLGWIGCLIINHSHLKPEGFKARTLSYLIWGHVGLGIYPLIASISNFWFDPNRRRNYGYRRTSK